jgi:hypothetical protein
MATKTLGTVLVVLICILLFPVVIGIIGGAFGIVVGVFGAVFGVFVGLIGGIFGAIVGVFGAIFEGLFGWMHWGPHFSFFPSNVFTIAAIVVIVIIAMRLRKK